MASLKGWEKVPGRAQYRNPAGEVVSRRQYDNARAREVGFSSYKQWEKLSHYGRKASDPSRERGRDFHRWSQQWAKQHGQKPKEARRLDSEFAKQFAQTMIHQKGKNKGQFKSPARMSKKAGGPLAKLLEGVGYRQSGAGYKVGNSPAVVEIPAAA